MGRFLATGRAGRLSLVAVGKPDIALLLIVCFTSGSGSETPAPSEIKVCLLCSVGLAEGTQLRVSLGGDTLNIAKIKKSSITSKIFHLSLLVSPPMLSFLAADDRSPSFGSVAGVVLTLLTGLRTTGTMESGMVMRVLTVCYLR